MYITYFKYNMNIVNTKIVLKLLTNTFVHKIVVFFMRNVFGLYFLKRIQVLCHEVA